MRVMTPGGRSLISVPMVPVLPRLDLLCLAGDLVLDLLDLEDLLLAGDERLGLLVDTVVVLLLAD